ncbi:hypothetical protein DQR93_22070 [Salmonella enterica subsp. enterica serovar Bovismorbificans]|uniref:hypothetical protein n=1 Tax=Salmonella enterica TaxID=28901 RepID=UPI0009B0B151|nr:hypothetical protein [Salmonella enterica]EBV2166727.1 hypothetical protein [Salmonella enterica subsp. enterica serovar Eastbourne]EDW6391984.1 hypothetical protein [Salmonella enterica subsp. enterica serovar Java]EEI1254562.1 hypothetical protein [Salmonella enterica subsp. enterica]EAR9882987.1 hypothetical protein [Salmonella enterica]EAT6345273.1 hypothetical protein [Salmonella enterica]
MLQMKFKPRFIEAFASGQKITSLRMMDFNCFTSDRGDELGYFHTDTLTKNLIIPDYSAGETMLFDKGAVFTRITDLSGLLKRQPYQSLSNIELVTEIEGGETVPFAVAFINDISVIKGDQITDEHAIRDGFNPENHPRAELFVFMRDVYPNKDPLNEMYWLYTFTNIQMLSQWRADA